jgi:Uncharacterized vancomycin resistance protein
MAAPKSRTALFAAVPLLILLLPIAVYLVDRAANGGDVPRDVTIAGVDVGGMSEAEAVAAVTAAEQRRLAGPAVFLLNGRRFELTAAEAGLEVDAATAVRTAMETRDTNLFSGFSDWLSSFRRTIDLPVTESVDPAAIDRALTAWEQEAVDAPAFNGAIRVVDGEVVADPPRSGLALDHDVARAIVTERLLSGDTTPAELPLADKTPGITPERFAAAVNRVRRMLDGPVILHNQDLDFTMRFQPADIAAALRVTVDDGPPASIDIRLDPDVIAPLVEPHRAEFELPPVDARYAVDITTDTVSIVPGRGATLFDPDAVAAALAEAAATDDFGDFPVAYGDPPEVTTADLEAYGPLTLVSEFTTHHKCCQRRVINIHLIADALDGAIVWPGEEFSINEYVGQRTLAKGYVKAPAIINGEDICCDSPINVGGGVSQMGTTLYNAVFFGCYEVLEHQPHSLYIHRYPLGREATLGYPHPDVRFRDDTRYPVIIRTSYTDTSLTVKFYGNNEGRKCYPDKDPPDKYNYTDPPVRYEPNPEVPPGEERVVENGTRGYTTTVTRIIEYPDGTVKKEPYTHRYRGYLKKIEVNPCEMPDATDPCPVLVPDVVGQGAAAATATLAGAGFAVTEVSTDVADPAQDGIVVAVSPTGWVPPGSTVTITVGHYVAPPPGDGGSGGGT